MKKIIYLLIIISFLYSCNCEKGSGKLQTKEYELQEFNEIIFKNTGTVKLSYSATPSLSIETDDNLFEFIDIENEKNKLEFSLNSCISNYTELNINLSLPTFKYLKIDGAVEVNCLDTFEIEELKIVADGAGELRLLLNVIDLETEISGAGNVELFGSTANHDVNIDGAGSLNAYQLKSNATEIEVEGAGSAFVSVNNKLKARVSGSGDINYKGNPQKIDTDATGAGKINRVD